MQPLEEISALNKQVATLQAEIEQKDNILQKACSIIRSAIPLLNKVKGWFWVGKKIKAAIDSIIGIVAIVCPNTNPDGQIKK